IVHMARELAHAGHDVTVYSTRPDPRAGSGRPAVESDTSAVVQYKSWNEFFQDCPAARWDVMISFRSFDPFLLGRIAPRMIFWCGDASNQPVLTHFEHPALQQNIDLVFCVSEWQRQSFIRQFQLPAEKVVATRNGFCPELVAPYSPRPAYNT